jgi:hypothetical protein
MEELTHAPDLRVAYVISPDKVVINKGSDDGVRQGQTFLFYAIGGNIKDPVTGENLGPLELIRGTGQVVHVQNRMSIVRSARQKPLYDRGAGFSSGPGRRRVSRTCLSTGSKMETMDARFSGSPGLAVTSPRHPHASRDREDSQRDRL